MAKNQTKTDTTTVGTYPDNVTDPKPQHPLMEGLPANKTVDERGSTAEPAPAPSQEPDQRADDAG